MTLDYQQVRQQVQALGENAPLREQRLKELRLSACQLLEENADQQERLRRKVGLVVHEYDPTLRCALPTSEPLNGCYPLPELPPAATILAADGSQISPDRHAQVHYCLINVGAIQMEHDSPEPPRTYIASQLIYGDELYTASGTITEARLALMRDLNERRMLAEMANDAIGPVISFTDGPLELWGGKDSGEDASAFQQSLNVYMQVLSRLHERQVVTAGYVDKPAANLLVRLLEVARQPEDKLAEIKGSYPLRGVTDRDLFWGLLQPGERSAVFGMQSKSAAQYRGVLGLHFFYLNVGRAGHPWLARVEAPAWVVETPGMLDQLHAVLVNQCRIMGSRPYPYLLHRAHEAALVTLAEKEQVTQMIVMELRKRGVEVGETSYKQSAKDLDGQKTRYSG